MTTLSAVALLILAHPAPAGDPGPAPTPAPQPGTSEHPPLEVVGDFHHPAVSTLLARPAFPVGAEETLASGIRVQAILDVGEAAPF